MGTAHSKRGWGAQGTRAMVPPACRPLMPAAGRRWLLTGECDRIVSETGLSHVGGGGREGWGPREGSLRAACRQPTPKPDPCTGGCRGQAPHRLEGAPCASHPSPNDLAEGPGPWGPGSAQPGCDRPPPASPTELDEPRAAGTDGEKAMEAAAPRPLHRGGCHRGRPGSGAGGAADRRGGLVPDPVPPVKEPRLITDAALSNSVRQTPHYIRPSPPAAILRRAHVGPALRYLCRHSSGCCYFCPACARPTRLSPGSRNSGPAESAGEEPVGRPAPGARESLPLTCTHSEPQNSIPFSEGHVRRL